jgi:NitT/TauT family transport system permease protein
LSGSVERKEKTMNPEMSLKLAGHAAVTDHEADDAWRASRRRETWRRRVLPVLGLLLLLTVWWGAVAAFDIKPYIAPSPSAVFWTLVEKRNVLFTNLAVTGAEALGGFVLGNLAAILIATWFVHSRNIQDIFFPVALMLNAIPVVAKAPVLVLILGNGVEPKIAIAALVCFFPTLINTVRGLQSVNPQAMELMHVLSASKTEVFFKLRLYSALPFLFSAFRIAASTAVIGAVVGEWVGANAGIGALIIQATYNFDSALLYSAITMSALLSGTFYVAIALAERFVIRWQTDALPGR